MRITTRRLTAAGAAIAAAAIAIPVTAQTSTTTVPDAGHDTYRGTGWNATSTRVRDLAEIEQAAYRVDGDNLVATVTLAHLQLRPRGIGHTIAIRAKAGRHDLKLTARPDVYESLTVNGESACPGQVTSETDVRAHTVAFVLPVSCLPRVDHLTSIVAESWISPEGTRPDGTQTTIARDAAPAADLRLP